MLYQLRLCDGFPAFRLADELGQETGDNQNDDAHHEHPDGLGAAALPLFQDDTPYIREHHIQGHEDAEGEGHERG